MAEKNNNGSKRPNFVTQFKHWRSGKIIRAVDYGLKAFPIGNR
jgi:hypothetical protein